MGVLYGSIQCIRAESLLRMGHPVLQQACWCGGVWVGVTIKTAKRESNMPKHNKLWELFRHAFEVTQVHKASSNAQVRLLELWAQRKQAQARTTPWCESSDFKASVNL